MLVALLCQYEFYFFVCVCFFLSTFYGIFLAVSWLCLGPTSADPEVGGTGGPDPLENHKLYGCL